MAQTINKIWKGANHIAMTSHGFARGIDILWNSLAWNVLGHIVGMDFLTSLIKTMKLSNKLQSLTSMVPKLLIGWKGNGRLLILHDLLGRRWIGLLLEILLQKFLSDQEGGLPLLDLRDHIMISQFLELRLVEVNDPSSTFTSTNKRDIPHSRKVKVDRFLVSILFFA